VTNIGPGSIVDSRFEVRGIVGQGGMGVVYRARQMDIDRDVALKMLKGALAAEPDKMKRFRREAQMISRLDHPNIVRVYAIGAEKGQPYIAMEYLSGRQLSDIVEADGPMQWRAAIRVFMQICDALAYAHEKEIIHRDIKPSNILVTDDGTVKLVDFGIAKPMVSEGQQLTQTEMVMGSVFYLSPGQFQGRAADPHSDMYSFGCTAYEVLSGAPPFAGDTIFDTIEMKSNDVLPDVNSINPHADIPSDLQRLLLAMTHKDTEKRPDTMASVKSSLQKILDGQAITIGSLDAPAPRAVAVRWRPKVTIMISVASLMAFALLSAFVYLWWTAAQMNFGPPKDRNIALRDEKLARAYIVDHEPVLGIIAAERALDNTTASDHELRTEIYYDLGTASADVGSIEKALEFTSNAMDDWRRPTYPLEIKKLTLSCYLRHGDYRKVVKLYKEICEKYGSGKLPLVLMQVSAAANNADYYQVAYDLGTEYGANAEISQQRYDIVLSRIICLVASKGLNKPTLASEWVDAEMKARSLEPGYARALALIFLARGYNLSGDPAKAVDLLREGIAQEIASNQPDYVRDLREKQLTLAHFFAVTSGLPVNYQAVCKDAAAPLLKQEDRLLRRLHNRKHPQLKQTNPRGF
jgi:predicted Ser/Thr protein kinase